LRVPGDTDWALEDRPAATASIGFVSPGGRHSMWVMFHDRRFAHWYVNFERNSRWRPPILDFVDEKLDLVVSADGAVRVKDEDEPEQGARGGYLDAKEVRAELEGAPAVPPWSTG